MIGYMASSPIHVATGTGEDHNQLRQHSRLENLAFPLPHAASIPYTRRNAYTRIDDSTARLSLIRLRALIPASCVHQVEKS
ncbi:hypothetical protein RSAG8_06885, partial [Rhizoctonia solani AG-8 WAC10335]